ncbi:hypothetical protein CEXT_483841 [Caerostris extrusa]|uniref:Uncharacterized protein n=1 Tax=Caerostris extrusa TaxID=172846 RepID=A0AAV4S948_CAEEX|nr:hypothetical protein CEXT_483841 [Caerostris extrusa]
MDEENTRNKPPNIRKRHRICRYKVLDPHLKLFRDALLIDDNARPHRVPLVNDYLGGKEWSSSPDLSPIEYNDKPKYLFLTHQTPASAKAKPVPQVHLPSMIKTVKNTRKQKDSLIRQTKHREKLHSKTKDFVPYENIFNKPPERTTVLESASLTADSSHDCVKYEVNDMVLD